MLRINLFTLILAVVAALVLMPAIGKTAPAEGNMKVIKKGDVYIISELGVTVIQEGDSLKVDMKLPTKDGDEKTKSVNIKAGDYIIMMNGKSVKSISDLEGGYQVISDGDIIKLGMKRDKDLFIVSFDKDSKIKPGERMMVVTKDISGDEDKVWTADESKSDMVTVMKGDAHMVLLPSLSLILEEKDDGLYVGNVVEVDEKPSSISELKEGDKLLKMQGKEIKTEKQLTELYDSIEYGTMVNLVFDRNGDILDLNVEKHKSEMKNRVFKIKQGKE